MMNKLLLILAASLAAFNAHAVTANIYGHDTVKIVEQSAVPVLVTNTTAETTQANLVIPGNSIGTDGAIRIHVLMSHTNNANNKTIKVKLGGVVLNTIVDTTSASLNLEMYTANRGAANSQVSQPVGANSFGVSASAVVTAAVDTSKDQPLLITCQLAVSTDTCQLERFSVEILKPN